MCGIAGYSLYNHASPSVDWLHSAVERLAHRGPDDSGVFSDLQCGIGLVHTRLSILELSSLGSQPMKSEDGSVVLVFNGEIYNYKSLKAELKSLGFAFRGDSDTEVLLSLYLAHRHQHDIRGMLRSLNGIFAFALWDSTLGSTLLVRDAFGVKPLYFQHCDSGLYFSSELKALPLGNLTLDHSSVDRYLSHLWSPGPGTPAHEVKKLGPGEAVWLSSGAIKEHFSWFCLPLSIRSSTGNSPSSLSREEAISGTAAHLRNAVHRQMEAHVPVGAFLSGGLDSSSIVAFARELNPSLHCFTIDFIGRDHSSTADDLPYARMVADYLDVPLDVVNVHPVQMAQELPGLVAQLDEPLADPAPLNVLYISRLAREQGIKVLLSGAGGDDIFTGYRRHSALMSEAFWDWLPRPARIGLARLSARLDQRQPLLRRLTKYAQLAPLEGTQRLLQYFRWISRQDLNKLYTSDFRDALSQDLTEDPMISFLVDLPPGLPAIERLLLLEQRFFLPDHNLNYTDKMSMSVGVEVRVPFLDIDLVRFASLIPPCYKYRSRQVKWVLKKAMEPYLPKEVIYRPKTGFGAPLRRWLRFELRDWLFDLLSPARLQKRGIFDSDAVHRLIVANSQGRIDATYTLFSLACLELWCGQFLDAPTMALPPSHKL